MTPDQVSDERLALLIMHFDWKCDEDLASALRELQRLRGGQWQPIETAPRDGTWMLCYGGGHISHACGDEDGFGGHGWRYADWNQPTHWQPLPEPPK